MHTIQILIADDHGIVRQGVMYLASEAYSNANFTQATDYTSLYATLNSQHVDLLICDINMPGLTGFSQVERIRKDFPQLKILIFSAYDEEIYAIRYLQAGANGFLHKNSDDKIIKTAIEEVMEKGSYASPTIYNKLLNNVLLNKQNNNPLEKLSNREIEIAKLLIDGLGILEISNILNIHTTTVSTYKSRLFEKLEISSVPQLIKIYENYSQHYNKPAVNPY